MTGNITPETDASCGYALSSHYGRLEGSYLQMDRSGPFVHAEVARKLERERDDAREDLEFRRGLYKVQEEHLENARKELNEWQALCLWGGTPEHIHNFIKGQQTRIHEAQDIEKTCEQLERERDEAITRRMETIMQCELYEQERDEAREQVKELIYIAGRAIDLAEIDFENDKFGVVSELRNGLEKIKEEAK